MAFVADPFLPCRLLDAASQQEVYLGRALSFGYLAAGDARLQMSGESLLI